MSNLSIRNTDRLKHDNKDVLLMRLNGETIYKRNGFFIEYKVNTDSLNEPLNDICIPWIYSDDTNYINRGYKRVEIIKLDGTITSDLSTPINTIKKIKVWFPKDTYKMTFPRKVDLQGIGPTNGLASVEHINTSGFVSMKDFFADSKLLESINCLSNFDTSNVVNMYHMFYCCYKVQELDCSSFNTSNVTDMTAMFSNCREATTINVSNFNTDNVNNMRSMFSRCESVKSLNVSRFNTANVTDMCGMFYGCLELESLNVRNFNTSNVNNMEYMFYDCEKLTSLDCSKWNMNNVAIVQSMFDGCSSLESLDLSGWTETAKNVKVGSNYYDLTVFNYLFNYCTSLKTLDMGNLDMSYIAETYNMFNSCYSLENFNPPKNISTSIDFSSCYNLTHESLIKIINNLAEVSSTQTLTLNSSSHSKLSDSEILIATSKGWTLNIQ